MVECESGSFFCMNPHDLRFNRYMVECEFAAGIGGHTAFPRFNRYMVECEYRTHPHQPFPLPVLIDTWWNVNTESLCAWFNIRPVLIDTWWNVNLSTVIDLKTSLKF